MTNTLDLTIELAVKKTQKEYFENFTTLYTELNMLNEDIKQLSESFKEDYLDADLANLKAVAKLKAEQKVGDKVLSVNNLLNLDTFAYNIEYGELHAPFILV